MPLHNGLFIVWLGQTVIDVHVDVLACYSGADCVVQVRDRCTQV